MTRPVIGVVANYYEKAPGKWHGHSRLNIEYSDAILAAGGLPVILPVIDDRSAMEQFLDSVSGVVFGGGYDIDPARYGQPKHPKTELLASRLETFVFAMFELADRRPGLPALGICLGCQLFNVARGGTLHQHLPDVPRPNAVAHVSAESPYSGGRQDHRVRVEPGTRLAQAVGGAGEIAVNSGHHQAIDRVGSGLLASAACTDGIVEAVEDPARRFFISVQWHPEDLAGQPDQPQSKALFRSLVEAAAGR